MDQNHLQGGKFPREREVHMYCYRMWRRYKQHPPILETTSQSHAITQIKNSETTSQRKMITESLQIRCFASTNLQYTSDTATNTTDYIALQPSGSTQGGL